MWNPGSEAAAWAGGSHVAGSETVSYDLSWFLASGVRSYSEWTGYLREWCGGWGKENERGRGVTVG